MTIAAAILSGVLAAASLLAAAPVVAASVPAAPTLCSGDQFGTRTCTVVADTPGGGGNGQPVTDGGTGNSGNGGGSAAAPPPGCTHNGVSISCVDPRRGGVGTWNPARMCYLSGPYTPAEAGEPWLSEADDPERSEQTLYQCVPPLPLPLEINYIWTGGAADPVPVIDPEVLAYQAIEQMTLQPARIGTAPPPAPELSTSMALVGMEMWMWVQDPDAQTWGPITRTASAGAVTVSATAQVTHADWDMGDGTVVTCAEGVQWRTGMRDAPCGHTYTRTSRDQPDGAYPITATTHWQVEWAGGGQNGTIDFTLADATSLRVGEVQVIRVS